MGLRLCITPQVWVSALDGGARSEGKSRVWWGCSFCVLLSFLCRTWSEPVPSLRKRSQGSSASGLGWLLSMPTSTCSLALDELVALLINPPESSSAGNAFCPKEQLEKHLSSKGLSHQCCKPAPGPPAREAGWSQAAIPGAREQVSPLLDYGFSLAELH